MKRIIPLLTLMILSNISYAQSSNIQLSAIISSGCIVFGDSFNFGDILDNSKKTTTSSLTIQCNKGTQVTITGSDKNNPTFTYGPRMWKEGVNGDFPETRLRYGIYTDLATSTSDLSIIKHPYGNYIWNAGSGQYDYRFIVKSLTGKAQTITLKGLLLNNIGTVYIPGDPVTPYQQKELIPGNYYDEFTYNLNF